MTLSEAKTRDQTQTTIDHAAENRPAEEMQESIDLLGASVVRLKQDQTIEGQEVVEELEARYLRLRQDFAAWQDLCDGSETGFQSSDNSSNSMADKATETFERAKGQVAESFNNFKHYVTDESNRAEFQKRSEELRDSLGQAWADVSKSFVRLFNATDGDKQSSDRTGHSQ